ncbi:MAG: hypothetical protein QM760_23550 [Nibricoccus sp.]
MNALQHIETLVESIKAPDVFTKSPQKRDQARKALESLFMLSKNPTVWAALDKVRMELGKIFDPTISREDTVAAHTKLLGVIPEITSCLIAKLGKPGSALAA